VIVAVTPVGALHAGVEVVVTLVKAQFVLLNEPAVTITLIL
jgi:hypothetical protein